MIFYFDHKYLIDIRYLLCPSHKVNFVFLDDSLIKILGDFNLTHDELVIIKNDRIFYSITFHHEKKNAKP